MADTSVPTLDLFSDLDVPILGTVVAQPPVRHNPFVGVSERFFGSADRTRQLDELRHLSRWSRRLLIVTGPCGVGKSALYRALSGSLDAGVKAARLNANLTSDAREVLAGMLQGFGVAAPANSSAALLAELVGAHVEEQALAHRQCLVLVDDAHLLELRALEHLLRLVDTTNDDALRIVFFAEASFVHVLDKASRRMSKANAWHEIRLSPFTLEDMKRYIAFRSAEGRGDRQPFSNAQLDLIWQQSGGMPARVNAIAAGLFDGAVNLLDARHGLPRAHRAVAMLVLAFVVSGWLAWTSYRDRPASMAVEPAAPHGDVSRVALPMPSSVGAGSPATSPSSVGEGLPATPSSSVGAGLPATAGNDASQPIVERMTDAVTAAPSVAPDAPLPHGGNVPSPMNLPPPAVPADSAPTAAKPSAPPPAQAEPKPAPKPALRGIAWIKAQPASNLTLQLFSTGNREPWQRYVDAHANDALVAGYQTKRNGAPLYVVLYGSFATQADAESASRNLPAGLAAGQPWVRTFKSVQQSFAQ